MATLHRSIFATLMPRVATLRFPTLTAIAAALFFADLLIPDFIPLADEILLGLVTAALASWKRERRGPQAHPERRP